MDNNLRRIIIATIISFAFFAAYDYFVLQPQTKPQITNQVVEKKEDKVSKSINIKSENIATINAKNYQIKIDSLGRISSYILKQNIYNEKGKHIELISPNLPKPLEVRFLDKNLNKEVFKNRVEVSSKELNITDTPKTLTITHYLTGLTLKKEITFYPDGHYDLKTFISKPTTYYISDGYRPSVEVDPLTVHGALIKKSDDTLEIIEDGDAKDETINSAKIVANFDRYYTTLLFSKKPFEAVVSSDKEENPIIFIKSDSNLNLIGYIGPKLVDRLASIDKELVDVVQYGVGTFFARNLFLVLDAIYKAIGNWGIAIILLVVLVRVILFPLTFRGMVSMYKLKDLAPKLKEIQEKYKKDPQKLQMHMMKIYKEEKVNPLGGCLPLLLQIPIFYGIYKVLLYSIELKGVPFLWVDDLSVKDPYFIWPVLMGITMYFHQKLTPTNFQDPMQEKVFKFLPVIFTIMIITFPAGLVIYWTVNNILSIIQQWIINSFMAAKKGSKK